MRQNLLQNRQESFRKCIDIFKPRVLLFLFFCTSFYLCFGPIILIIPFPSFPTITFCKTLYAPFSYSKSTAKICYFQVSQTAPLKSSFEIVTENYFCIRCMNK